MRYRSDGSTERREEGARGVRRKEGWLQERGGWHIKATKTILDMEDAGNGWRSMSLPGFSVAISSERLFGSVSTLAFRGGRCPEGPEGASKGSCRSARKETHRVRVRDAPRLMAEAPIVFPSEIHVEVSQNSGIEVIEKIRVHKGHLEPEIYVINRVYESRMSRYHGEVEAFEESDLDACAEALEQQRKQFEFEARAPTGLAGLPKVFLSWF